MGVARKRPVRDAAPTPERMRKAGDWLGGLVAAGYVVRHGPSGTSARLTTKGGGVVRHGPAKDSDPAASTSSGQAHHERLGGWPRPEDGRIGDAAPTQEGAKSERRVDAGTESEAPLPGFDASPSLC